MARKGRIDRGLLARADVNGNRVWYVRLWHEGRERRFGSFGTKTQARDFYEKAKQEQRTGRFFPERYQHGGYETVQDFLERHKQTRSDRRDHKGEECFFKFWTIRFKGQRLNAITPTALESARQSLFTYGPNPGHPESKGCSPQRANRYMEWLRHALNLAVRDGKLQTNPVSRLAMFKEPPGATRFLSIEEEKRLCEKIGPVYAPWVRFAILTGWRRGEQFSLRWADVDLDQGILTLRGTKAGGVQSLHLNEEAKAILRSQTSWERSAWVFPSKNPAKPVDTCNFYRRIYVPAVKSAGLKGVTWHTLRHTLASRLAMGGATDYDIAACLRHSTTALVRRYAHLSQTHLRWVMERVSMFSERTREPYS